MRVFYLLLKRLFDMGCALLGLIVSSPLWLIVMLGIELSDPGPVFYIAHRTTKHNRVFNMFKFRSMREGKANESVFRGEEDRIFPFGRFIRATKLDELPQLLNILIGDMSIVGPRPHMLLHTATYSQLISKYMIRQFVRPGVTGWAQVTGFRGETSELWQMEERVKRDVWYINHWSALQDVRIILMTVALIFKKDKMAY